MLLIQSEKLILDFVLWLNKYSSIMYPFQHFIFNWAIHQNVVEITLWLADIEIFYLSGEVSSQHCGCPKLLSFLFKFNRRQVAEILNITVLSHIWQL